jgi:hypothetical protein
MACRKFHQERPVHQRVTPVRQGLLRCTKQPQASVEEADVPIYIGYLRLSDAVELPASPAKAGDLPHVGNDEMTPLMFAAGLIRDSDLEATVTILQQVFRRFWPGTRRNEARRTRRTQRGSGESRGAPAKDLGKRWRFFPTYAEV